MHPRRALLRARSLSLVLTMWLVTSCGYVGVELLGEDADGGPDALPDAAMMVNAAPLDPGLIDTCLGARCASQIDRCPTSPRDWGGVCGCSGSDVDSDRDGTPDCVDSCPNEPDRLPGGICGCEGAERDNDGDGVPNCNDLCANDTRKSLPGTCGCGISETDTDGDKMPDCADQCPSDASKVVTGSCGCGKPETDTDRDGMPDCVDVCNGLNDASYVPIDTCGVGYCLSSNMPSSCVAGVEIACMPGEPLSSTDATCNNIDDNCNGMTDEGYPVVAQCGVGYCRSTSTASRCVAGVETVCSPGARRSATDATCDGVDDNCNGATDESYVVVPQCGQGICRTNSTTSSCVNGVQTSCVPGAPRASNDLTPDGVDDDCDGLVDEDACTPHTDTFSYRSAVYVITPPAGCTRATVKLWGGAGASGSNDGGAWGAGITGGIGGAGGYAQQTLTGVLPVSTMQLYLGQGGQGCSGGSSGSTTYRGGSGGSGNGGDGTAGANGSVMGGTGNNPGQGGRGGVGSFGGGGGGAGARLYTTSGPGGDGGGGTVLLLSGTRTLTAGGGAGGGGAGSNFTASGSSGGAGGAGCMGNGSSATNEGGGGGGGGICQGTIQQRGSGRVPFDGANDLAAGAALGGAQAAECGSGGNGYAIISWAP